MTGLLAPVFKEVYKGKAEVRETFRITQGRHGGRLPWCIDGTITRDSEVRAAARQRRGPHRQDRLAAAVQRRRQRSASSGMECGITLENYNDVKQGDIIEAFVTERVATEVFA